MVVDAQPDAAQQGPEFLREHPRGGHVHADDAAAFRRFRHGQPLMEPPEPGTDPFVFQDVGGFAQAAQAQAKGRGGADGVAVGAGVGENEIVVMGGQKIGGFSPRQILHGRSPGN